MNSQVKLSTIDSLYQSFTVTHHVTSPYHSERKPTVFNAITRTSETFDQTPFSRDYVSVKTNIDLDVKLVEKAFKMTGFRTKKELVHYALSELVRRKEQKSLLNLRGKVNWSGNLEEMRETRF